MIRLIVDQGLTKFLDRAAFYLPDAFLGDSELVAKCFQGQSILIEPALSNDPEFTFVEDVHCLRKPGCAALVIYLMTDNLVGQRIGAGDEILPVGTGAV